jgi:hypothetical protein
MGEHLQLLVKVLKNEAEHYKNELLGVVKEVLKALDLEKLEKMGELMSNIAEKGEYLIRIMGEITGEAKRKKKKKG